MDVLQKLFGSQLRVKALRLFLFNPKQSFAAADVVDRSRCTSGEVRRELALFLKMKLIKKARKSASSGSARFVLNENFPYTSALQTLLLSAPSQGSAVLRQIRPVGALKFLVLSGVFLGEWQAGLDLLIVGDNINNKKLRKHIKIIEGDMGRELRYASLGTQDFYYRLNMSDHLVRDVLDYPHRVVLDKLNIGLS